MAEKVTQMVLNVDLQCACCYKKIKKILCKFPQIRDQVYDEMANTVTITVVCCNPQKVRDKLCDKGAKVIKTIKIKGDSERKIKEFPKPEMNKGKRVDKGHPTSEKPDLTPPTSPERRCYCGFRVALPPPPQCFEGKYGNGYHEGCCHVTRCDYYFSEENPQACSIM